MPYIPEKDREVFQFFVQDMEDCITRRGISNGELNYLFTRLSLLYLGKHGTSYNTISDVIKALECAKLEFYARVARPYEEKKIEQNGDVY